MKYKIIIAVADKPRQDNTILTKEACADLARREPEKYTFNHETNELSMQIDKSQVPDNALDVRYTHTVAFVEDGEGNVSTHAPVKIQFVHGPPAKY